LNYFLVGMVKGGKVTLKVGFLIENNKNTSLRGCLTQPSPKERALKHFLKVSPFGGDLEGASSQ
jgi:hypothetical protein